MNNLVNKNMTSQYNYYCNSWGYYYNAGFLAYEKFIRFINNEFTNRLKLISLCSEE